MCIKKEKENDNNGNNNNQQRREKQRIQCLLIIRDFSRRRRLCVSALVCDETSIKLLLLFI